MRKKVLEKLKAVPGKTFRLKDHDPGWIPPEFKKLPMDEVKSRAAQLVEEDRQELAESQVLLWADDRYSLLIVLQAMDAAGKDSTIKHVMSGVNPQGCQVVSFKQPSAEELDHDFLWRASKALPERGSIGIFNRSYYEEVLVVRVHPEILEAEKLPQAKRDKSFWQQRYEDINAFEQHLVRNGTVILKLFLNVSKEEQRKRFLKRLDDPAKNWKFSLGDVAERAHWDDYMQAYEACINATSTESAPWWVIPADHKWATRAVVADIVTTTIKSMDLRFPPIDEKKKAEIEEARRKLEADSA